MTRSPSVNAFTLVELLTVITITAILVTVAVFYTAGYVAFAKHTSDQQTLAVLNDALNRYKCDGGDVNALTASAPIANVLAKLQAPIHWAGGLTHQVMQAGITYPACSLTALGDFKH